MRPIEYADLREQTSDPSLPEKATARLAQIRSDVERCRRTGDRSTLKVLDIELAFLRRFPERALIPRLGPGVLSGNGQQVVRRVGRLRAGHSPR